VVSEITLGTGEVGGPPRLAPDGRSLFVSAVASPRVFRIDVAARSVNRTYELESRAGVVAVTADGRSLLVPQPDTGMVAVLDIESGRVSGRINTRGRPGVAVLVRGGRGAYIFGGPAGIVSVDLPAGTIRADIGGLVPFGEAVGVVPGACPACPGDCDGDGTVTVDELVTAVNIALGARGLDACPPADASRDGSVSIDDLVRAVNAALNGCGMVNGES